MHGLGIYRERVEATPANIIFTKKGFFMVSGLASGVFSHLGWEPWPEQKAILGLPHRYVLVRGGGQAGKSETAAKFFQSRWLRDMADNEDMGDGKGGPLLYWLIGSDYGETRTEFDLIAQDFVDMGLPAKFTKRVDPGSIEVAYPGEAKPRIRIETKSGTQPQKMSQKAPNGIIMCEAGQLTVEVFERAQERLTPHNGWLLMVGTFEMEVQVGWYRTLAKAWGMGYNDRISVALPTWANRSLFPGGRSDPKILQLEKDSSERFFMERIAGELVPPQGIVFPEFQPDIHIRDVRWESGKDVYLWEDPGYGSESAHAVLVAHILEGQVRVFDEIYEQGLITEEIISICQGKPWWKDVKFLVSDPHYKNQHHSMSSVGEIWLQKTGLFAGPESSIRRIRINSGIERMKSFLKPDPITGVPKIVFSTECRGALSEFGAGVNPINGRSQVYRWRMDNDGNIVGDVPIDRFNHSIKAAIYGIVDQFGYAHAADRKVIKTKRWDT